MLLVAILFLLVVSSGAFYIANRVSSDVKEMGAYTLYSNLAEVAKSGLNITKEALNSDSDWSDCQGANQNCNSTDPYGYYPLYSNSLAQTIQNYRLNNIDLSVYVKPVNTNNIKVIVVAKNPNNYEELVLGARFNRVISTDKLPIMYGGASTNVIGGKVCSYYWDGTKVQGKTNPNLSVYMDSNFYFSAQVEVPSQGQGGQVPKDVRFFTNFDTVVQGYKVIDKLYSTGSVYLKNGAKVGYVEAGGTITTDKTSSCTTCVENSSWQYPNFNTTLTDNVIPNYTGQDLTINCGNGSATIPAGTYRNITITGKNKRCTITIAGQVNVRNFTVGGNKVSGNTVNILVDPSAGQLNVKNLTVTNNNTVNIDPQGAPLKIVGDTMNVTNNGDLVCQDPRFCLYDFNNVSVYCGTYWWGWFIPCSNDTQTFVQGTVLARNQLYLASASFIGNIFAENLNTWGGRVCNIVDSNGNQILPTQNLGFYTVVSSDPTLLDPIVSAIYQTICPSYQNCAGSL